MDNYFNWRKQWWRVLHETPETISAFLDDSLPEGSVENQQFIVHTLQEDPTYKSPTALAILLDRLRRENPQEALFQNILGNSIKFLLHNILLNEELTEVNREIFHVLEDRYAIANKKYFQSKKQLSHLTVETLDEIYAIQEMNQNATLQEYYDHPLTETATKIFHLIQEIGGSLDSDAEILMGMDKLKNLCPMALALRLYQRSGYISAHSLILAGARWENAIVQLEKHEISFIEQHPTIKKERLSRAIKIHVKKNEDTPFSPRL